VEVAALNHRQQKDLARLDRLELERAAAARETQELSSRLGALTNELAGLAQETQALAARVDRALVANAERTDPLSGELQAVRERLTAMAGQLQEITTRLAAPPAAEPPSVAAPVAPAPPPAAPVVATPAPPPPVPAPAPSPSSEPRPDSGAAAAIADPQSLYSAGYTDFGRGNYPLAIGAFREFIRRHPQDDLADNAQYWIAEAYLGLAHRYVNAAENERAAAAFAQAIEAFQTVWQRYPHGDKVPAAMFREAGIHFELGQRDQARARLEYLVERFPSAPEARQARQRLAEGASQ
jgi:tol-pal system protein YbgF